METRICSACEVKKPLDDLFFRKESFLKKDETQAFCYMKKCRDCHNLWQMENYFKNKLPKVDDGYTTCKYCNQRYLHSEFKTAFMCLYCFEDKKSKRDKKYNEAHKAEKSAKDKKYKDDNKAAISEKSKIRYLANRENVLKRVKAYRKDKMMNDPLFVEKERRRSIERAKKNKPRRNKWRQEKKIADPSYKLRALLSKRIWQALKENGGSKAGVSFIKIFSYSMDDLKIYLEGLFEPWMTWNNHGNYIPKTWDDNDQSTWTWQIDHIIPHSTFHYTSMEDEEFKKCWALSNLRPLSAKQNIIDGCRR